MDGIPAACPYCESTSFDWTRYGGKVDTWLGSEYDGWRERSVCMVCYAILRDWHFISDAAKEDAPRGLGGKGGCMKEFGQ